MNKLRNRPFAVFVGVSGLAIMLSAYFLTLFGIIDLSGAPMGEPSPLVEFLVFNALFFMNVTVAFSVSCQMNFKSSLVFGFAYIFCHVIVDALVQSSLITSGVLPGVGVAVLAYIKRYSVLRSLARYAVFSILIIAYQSVSLSIERLFVGIRYISHNWLALAVLSIDLLLVYIFILEVIGLGLDRKPLAVPEEVGVPVDEETGEEDLSHRQKAIFITMVMGFQLVQLLAVLSIGHLNNMLVELAVMLILFWAGRKILGVSYHGSSLWWCSTVAFGTFYVMTKVTPPFEISLFSVIAASSLLAHVLHVVAVKQAWIEFYEQKYETDFTRYGLSHEAARFAHDWLVEGLSDKELLVKYDIRSVNTLNSRKRRIKAKMHTK